MITSLGSFFAPSHKMTVVYLLQSVSVPRRTYVGCTAHPVERRLRQHNGDLSGGARQTSTGRPWRLVLTVEGFRTRREGLQFEYAWRRVHRRRRCGYCVDGRVAALDHLAGMERWSRNAPLASDVPLTRSMHAVHGETEASPHDV